MKAKPLLLTLAAVGVFLLVLSLAIPEASRAAYFGLGFNDHPTWYTEQSLMRRHQDDSLAAELRRLEDQGRQNSYEYIKIKVYADSVCLESLKEYETRLTQELQEAREHGYDGFYERRQQLLESTQAAIAEKERTIADLKDRARTYAQGTS